MPIIDVEVGIVNLTQQERRYGISGKRLERAVGVVASRLIVAKVVGPGDIAVTDSGELVVAVFKASGNGVFALDPGDVVEELPPVSNVPFRNVVRFSIMRVGNGRTVEIDPRRATVA